jgi:Rho family protein
MELSLWDTAGQEEFDRLRSLSYDDTQAIMLCFSVSCVDICCCINWALNGFEQVENRDSLENVSTKWIAEINEHCPGVKIVLVALKCDLREEQEKDDDEGDGLHPRHIVTYNEGLAVARRIGALRYLGKSRPDFHGKKRKGGGGGGDYLADHVIECSAMRNRGVNEAFTEAARVALQVKPAKSKESNRCTVM